MKPVIEYEEELSPQKSLAVQQPQQQDNNNLDEFNSLSPTRFE